MQDIHADLVFAVSGSADVSHKIRCDGYGGRKSSGSKAHQVSYKRAGRAGGRTKIISIIKELQLTSVLTKSIGVSLWFQNT
jgi:hypothetical protein